MKQDTSGTSESSLDSDYAFSKPGALPWPHPEVWLALPKSLLASWWTHFQPQNLWLDWRPGWWPARSCPAQNHPWYRHSCDGKTAWRLCAPACSLATTVGPAAHAMGLLPHPECLWSWPVFPKPPWDQNETTYSSYKAQDGLAVTLEIQIILTPPSILI